MGASNMVSLLCGSVREGSERGQCCCLASRVLSKRKQSPSTHPDARLFNFSHMPLVPFQLLLRCRIQRERESVSPKSDTGPLRGDSWESCSFFHNPNPHWFLEPEVIGTYLPGTGTQGWMVLCGAGMPRSRGILPNFYLTHVCVDHPFCLSTSLPLLPIWMNVTFLIPWL